jgi:uncharacterized membrane protein
MATLIAWKFESAAAAEQAAELLQQLSQQQLIRVQDAAIVSWPLGAKKPKTRQLYNLAGMSALNGAFWGMLFGMLFFIPLLGLAIGAGMGALTGALMDVGIDDRFIKEVRSKVTEGTSALFLLSDNAVVDHITDAAQQAELKADLIASNLSNEQERKLHEVFGE